MQKETLFIAVLALSTLAFAQRSQQEAAAEAPDNTSCSFLYSSGSGLSFTRYCLSVNGNIVQFDSPSGYEFIDSLIVSEGYGVCDATAGKAYFDYAHTDSNNWGATVVSAPNATTRKFVRTTADGLWQLTQTIKQIKANAKGPGSVSITMVLKNLSGIQRTVLILRHADVDAFGSENNDDFDFTFNSSFGHEPNGGFGLALTSNTITFNQQGFTQDTFSGPNPCNAGVNINSSPFRGDGSIDHFWGTFNVSAGGTRKIAMTYKPI